MPTPDDLFKHLCIIIDKFEEEKIPYTLAGGTLLGAYRDGDIIPHEERDFDIDILIENKEKVLSLNEKLVGTEYSIMDRSAGALDEDKYYLFDNMQDGNNHDAGGAGLAVLFNEELVGDIYLYTIFSDGIARRWEDTDSCSVNAKMACPAWFFEGVETVTIRGRKFQGPRETEAIICKIYGSDWSTPLGIGSFAKERHPDSGSVLDANIEPLILLALKNGWDGSYDSYPHWPIKIKYIGGYGNRRWVLKHEPAYSIYDEDTLSKAEQEILKTCFGAESTSHQRYMAMHYLWSVQKEIVTRKPPKIQRRVARVFSYISRIKQALANILMTPKKK